MICNGSQPIFPALNTPPERHTPMNPTIRNLLTLAGAASLLCLTSCVDVGHNIDVRGEAFGVQFTPATGTILGGYGSIDYHQANVVAGQGSMVIYEQYGMTTTNVLSRQIFATLPATDSTVTMQQATEWLLCVCGYGVHMPWGQTQTTVSVVPTGVK